MSTTVCPDHKRWTLIERADGTSARRACPECPKPNCWCGERLVGVGRGYWECPEHGLAHGYGKKPENFADAGGPHEQEER